MSSESVAEVSEDESPSGENIPTRIVLSDASQRSNIENDINPEREYTKRSSVWDYFSFDKELSKSTCKSCRRVFNGGYTTNLRGHLESKHKSQFEELKTKRNLSAKLKSNPPVVKYGLKSAEQRALNRSIAFWIRTECTIPVNVVTQSSFKDVIFQADPKLCVPSRATVRKNIAEIHSEMVSKICKKIQAARRLSISADIWTKKGLSSSYLGVLATFFDVEENKRCVLLLDVKEMSTMTHKAADILREMKTVVEKFNIPDEKVWFVTTDSASNMVCAFRDWSFHEEEYDEDSSGGIHEDQNETPETPYTRYSCFIHSLLLCLKPFDSDRSLKEVLGKVKDIIVKVTNSTILTGELIRKTNLRLLKFSKARWNITFLVIQRLMVVKDALIQILNDCGDPALYLSTEDWELLDQVCLFLEPFNKYTNMSSRDVDTYFSEVTVIIRILEEHLLKYAQGNYSLLQQCAKQILEELRGRFLSYSVEQSSGTGSLKVSRKPLELYLAATLVDPRNCQHLDSEEERIATKCIKTLIPLETPPSTENISPEIPEMKRRKYNLQPRTSRIVRTSATESHGIEFEINQYLNQKYGGDFEDVNSQSNPLEFWISRSKSYPSLSPIAIDLICLPMSTGPLERSFSYSGIATLGRKNGLEGENLSEEVTLSRNKAMLNLAVVAVLLLAATLVFFLVKVYDSMIPFVGLFLSLLAFFRCTAAFWAKSQLFICRILSSITIIIAAIFVM